MTDRELMQQALDALCDIIPANANRREIDRKQHAAITALRERLAQPEQCQCLECRVTPHASDCAVHNEPAYPKGECTCKAQPEQEPVAWHEPGACGNVTVYEKWAKENGWLPLYTAPQREWVGLSEEEIAVICGECAASAHRADDISYARAIEAKLKEKNNE